MKSVFDLIMRSPKSALEDVVGLTAITVMFIVALYIPSVL
jgi:hypothetical protein